MSSLLSRAADAGSLLRTAVQRPALATFDGPDTIPHRDTVHVTHARTELHLAELTTQSNVHLLQAARS